jgi:ABC-2 type transport system permease protein
MMSVRAASARTERRHPFRRLVITEAKLAWRQPIGLVWGVGMPVLLLVIFGSIPVFQEPLPEIGGITLFNAYVPILMIIVLSMLAFMGMPYPLASYRELGVLRRMSATPVPPSRILAAQLVVNLAMALIALVLIVVIGVSAFGLAVPEHMPGFLTAIALSAVCLFSLGLVVAAFARTGGAAAALGNALFFPLAFFAGLWFPQQQMPDLLRGISQATPTGAAVQTLNAAFAG